MQFFIIPGARMVPLPLGGWTFPYEVLSENGDCILAGGNSRMLAVRELFFKNLDSYVLVTGGLEDGKYSRSDELTKQLIDSYEIPSSHIFSLGGGGSTKGNALAFCDFLSRLSNLSSCSFQIVTNSYHALRAWIIFSDILFFHFFRKEPHFTRKLKSDISQLLDPNANPAFVYTQVTASLAHVFDCLPVSLKVSPVEEVLCSSRNAFYATYAQELFVHPLAFQALLSEYRGIQAYLDRSYGK